MSRAIKWLRREPHLPRSDADLQAGTTALRPFSDHHRVFALRPRLVRARGCEPSGRAAQRRRTRRDRCVHPSRHAHRGHRAGTQGRRGVSRSPNRDLRIGRRSPRSRPRRAGRVSGRAAGAGAQSPARVDRDQAEARVSRRRSCRRRRGTNEWLRLRGRRPVRERLGRAARPAAPARGGSRDRGRRAHRVARQRDECWETPEARMKHAVLLLLMISSVAAAQRPTYQQQMQENQQRLEGIRRERSEVEQELERLRTQAHSLSDEITNIEQQKQSTNRIVNELDRQITGLGGQIDQITVDLLIAQDALLEKSAVLERRLVDIYKRGALYSWQVLFAAESFGDLLSRYKYLYLVSRQDRLLTNDMHKLRDRVARQRQLLVDAREALAQRKHERTDELGRYLALERERQTSLQETRRSARQAEQRLTRLDKDERSLNDRIEALERARREAEARGATATTGSISTADLGGLDWTGDGSVIYPVL